MRYVHRLPQTTSACSESGASLPTGMKFFLSRLYGNFALKAKKNSGLPEFFHFPVAGEACLLSADAAFGKDAGATPGYSRWRESRS